VGCRRWHGSWLSEHRPGVDFLAFLPQPLLDSLVSFKQLVKFSEFKFPP
jgi:hypothetical protein